MSDATEARVLDDLRDATSRRRWTFVPLAPPRQLREAGFDPLPDLPAGRETTTRRPGLSARSKTA
jgi:hypothetical protein